MLFQLLEASLVTQVTHLCLRRNKCRRSATQPSNSLVTCQINHEDVAAISCHIFQTILRNKFTAARDVELPTRARIR
jgi:hypothetical protein